MPFAAIDKIMALHRATDMRSTKVRLTFIIESRRWRVDFRRCVFSLCNVFVSDIFSDVTVQELDMYPTAESLSNVELLYGVNLYWGFFDNIKSVLTVLKTYSRRGYHKNGHERHSAQRICGKYRRSSYNDSLQKKVPRRREGGSR